MYNVLNGYGRLRTFVALKNEVAENLYINGLQEAQPPREIPAQTTIFKSRPDLVAPAVLQ